jgi:hypothetical protein
MMRSLGAQAEKLKLIIARRQGKSGNFLGFEPTGKKIEDRSGLKG